MATIEEIQARREARKAELAEKRRAQLAIDLEALDAAEQEHGDERVKCVDLEGWEPGLPTMVILRMPLPIEYKRFVDTIKKDPLDAGRKLGEVCRIYPDDAAFVKIKERAPGFVDTIANASIKLGNARRSEQGKD